METRIELQLAEEIAHAAEDLERTDSGHTPQWLGGYIAGLATALSMLMDKKERSGDWGCTIPS